LGRLSDISISGGDVAVRSNGGVTSMSRRALPRSLEFWTLATIIVAIAAVIVLAFWLENEPQLSQVSEGGVETSCGQESWPYVDLRCRNDSGEKRRRIRLISTDRIEKTSVETATAPTIPMTTPIEVVETIGLSSQPAASESSDLAQPSADAAESVAPAVRQRIRDVDPRARAEIRARARSRNAEREPAPDVGLAREKSFTGAGNAFDAVH
jgi:hypothetical protein